MLTALSSHGAAIHPPLRLYDKRLERPPGPLLLFIHGGGGVIGDLESHEPFCIDLALGLDIPVIAVDYRPAPECPFPAGLKDSIAATRWWRRVQQQLGELPPRCSLEAIARGNLVCVLSAVLRNKRAHVPVAGQRLFYSSADPCVHYPML